MSIHDALNARILRLIVAIGLVAVTFGASPSAAQSEKPQRFDVQIANGRVADDLKTIRVKRNDNVEINFTADRRTVLHLHGYDIERTVDVGKPQTMSFTARATGRFPVETHGGRHSVILHVEVHPR
jgi:FtsP/CotA-like multicopper oxidase with cupredoxin domain